MDKDGLVAAFRESLRAVRHPRFFLTERGYQGELLTELRRRLRLPDDAIVEQEYQKNAQEHGLRIRPDIIVHEPYDPRKHANRRQGNFAVAELKVDASADQALEDFQSLGLMLNVLRYQVGIFVNIGSTQTHAEVVPADLKGRIVTFGVRLRGNVPEVIEARP